jgi:hypothetical protein
MACPLKLAGSAEASGQPFSPQLAGRRPPKRGRAGSVASSCSPVRQSWQAPVPSGTVAGHCTPASAVSDDTRATPRAVSGRKFSSTLFWFTISASGRTL